ncbi:MAG: 2-oxoacid:ferredoxin oxidoreductase subunit beta [Planctomycetes bacterium]|nr:2-oxoacid:ferredoxin oxidoreductase subunit beta [Planctomycetota bacterium]
MSEVITETPKLTKKDFVSGSEVRWCPGCGDYSILATVQKTLAELDVPKEKYCFISGIGCSSRFPYYMNTYGFHTIHGRAPAVASGIKVANPELDVWVISGDGDGLSIGGNHLIHMIRRNVNVVFLLFNNRIYGLTKGQYSPTSEVGKKTKSSPYGALDYPINPLGFAIGCEATFVARTLDVDPKHMTEVLKRAHAHKGCSFVEIWQNCHVFNNATFSGVTDRQVRSDQAIYLEHGRPLVFGKDRDKGIRLDNLSPHIVNLKDNGVKEDDLMFHDEHAIRQTHSAFLAHMEFPEFPTPFGVFRDVERATYDEALNLQLSDVRAKEGEGSLEELLYDGDLWTIQGATETVEVDKSN